MYELRGYLVKIIYFDPVVPVCANRSLPPDNLFSSSSSSSSNTLDGDRWDDLEENKGLTVIPRYAKFRKIVSSCLLMVVKGLHSR